MQKKMTFVVLVLFFLNNRQLHAQYDKSDTTYKHWFIGTSLFVLVGNVLEKENPPNFVQIDVGYRLTGKDVIRFSPKTWKYAWPNGIHPFLNDAYKKPEEKFPGYVREFGVTFSYTRFFWKGAFAQLDLMPTYQIFADEHKNRIDEGFQLFNSYRVGYHFNFFQDRFFFQISACMTHRAFHTRLPEDFKILDDKWPKIIFPEPGLNIGFNF